MEPAIVDIDKRQAVREAREAAQKEVGAQFEALRGDIKGLRVAMGAGFDILGARFDSLEKNLGNFKMILAIGFVAAFLTLVNMDSSLIGREADKIWQQADQRANTTRDDMKAELARMDNEARAARAEVKAMLARMEEAIKTAKGVVPGNATPRPGTAPPKAEPSAEADVPGAAIPE
ncbi:MAG: hypothetical protein LBR22_07125 [Desulfovibrio sp.]|nr:hypothetical protein [Desulfovibrio sp.]